MKHDVSSISALKYIIIDSRIAFDSNDKNFLFRILRNPLLKDKTLIVLGYDYCPSLTKEICNYAKTDHVITINNKSGASDINLVLEYVSGLDVTPINNFQDKVNIGKQILYLTYRDQKWIERFKDSEECPGFYNLKMGNFCPHKCFYCFLNLTLRMRPIPQLYLNFSRFKKEVKRFAKAHPEYTMVNCGESCDPLAFEPITHSFNEVAKTIGYEEKIFLLVLTKSCNVYDLTEDLGNVVFSWSVNPKPIQEKYELLSATIEQRLKAAKFVSDLGYKVRFRIDPIICPRVFEELSNGKKINYSNYADELECYYRLVDELLKIKVEGITLGTFRAYTTLFNFIPEFRFSIKLKKLMDKDVGHLKMPKDYRKWVFENISNYINGISKDVLVGYCKDTNYKNEDFCNCILYKI